MTSEIDMTSNLEYHPITPERWTDLEGVFGERGATGGCWCMYWRLKNAEFEARKGEKTHEMMKSIVDSGEIPGILGYVDGRPAGWCSVGVRETFPRLTRSRILQPVDDQSVWSVVCFFIVKPFRRQSLSVGLLKAAVDYASSRDATIIEGYPLEPRENHMPDVFAWTGLASAFKQAGFVEVARRSETRPIMRYIVE